MNRAFLGGIALVLGLATSGCFVSRAFGRSMGALVSTPKEVKKVADPVRKDARLSVLWVGHATVLVQIDDKFILTDPVFTNTVGMLSKRLYEPGIEPEKLPPIDAVLISHMHFDHLSLGSLEMIEKKTRNLFLPEGGAAYITDFGFPILELRRWQNWEKDGLRITAVPGAHVGFRYGVDSWMTTSFTGYVIEYHGIKVWFGGDTAYEQAFFVEAGERFPNLDLAIMPIGPTEPRDFMRHTHVDPKQAVQAFLDLGRETHGADPLRHVHQLDRRPGRRAEAARGSEERMEARRTARSSRSPSASNASSSRRNDQGGQLVAQLASPTSSGSLCVPIEAGAASK